MLKKLKLAVLTSLLVSSVLSNVYAAKDFVPIKDEVLLVKSNKLVYKGKTIKLPLRRDNLYKVLGVPSRIMYNSSGSVAVWDEFGISCFGCKEDAGPAEELEFMTGAEKAAYKNESDVESITIYVRKYHPYLQLKNQYEHEPEKPFPGKVVLSGVDIDAETTLLEFMEQRKGRQTILLPNNSFSFYIRCKPAPHEITMHSIRDKYDSDYLSIYSVSIRNIEYFYKTLNCIEVFGPQEPLIIEEDIDLE